MPAAEQALPPSATIIVADWKVSYTVREAAEATGLSQDTILAAIRSGDLRVAAPEVDGTRLKNKYVVLREDLIAWLRGRREAH